MTHGGDVNFGSLFTICRTRINVVGAQFALESAAARPIFYYLAEHAATVDKAFDTQPIWRNPVGSDTALVELRRNDGIEERAHWPDLFEWLRVQLETLQRQLWPLTGRTPPSGVPRKWDLDSFVDHMAEYNPWFVEQVKNVLEMSASTSGTLQWGRGRRSGTVSIGCVRRGIGYFPVTIATDGTFALNFACLATLAPFDDTRLRLELLSRFNRIPSLALSGSLVDARPTLPLGMIGRPAASALFMEVMDWVRRTVAGPRP